MQTQQLNVTDFFKQQQAGKDEGEFQKVSEKDSESNTCKSQVRIENREDQDLHNNSPILPQEVNVPIGLGLNKTTGPFDLAMVHGQEDEADDQHELSLEKEFELRFGKLEEFHVEADYSQMLAEQRPEPVKSKFTSKLKLDGISSGNLTQRQIEIEKSKFLMNNRKSSLALRGPFTSRSSLNQSVIVPSSSYQFGNRASIGSKPAHKFNLDLSKIKK